MKRMYLISALEYTNGIRSNIIKYSICNTLEEALLKGKYYIKEYVCDKFDMDIDEVSNTQYDQLIKIDNCTYILDISVFSTSRKNFNSPKELMDYFNSNIKNISNENLYDFLLSLVECDSRIYDYKGLYQNNLIFARQFLLEQPHAYDLSFTEESCVNGIYEFWFR